MKITTIIILSITSILLLFSLTTYVNFLQSKQVRDNTNYLANSTLVVRQSFQLQKNILYMERGLRGFIMTGDQYLLQTYDSAVKENGILFQDLLNLVPSNTFQRRKLENIISIYNGWINHFAEPLKKIEELFPDSMPGRKLIIGKKLNEEEKISKDLQEEFKKLLNAEYQNREEKRSLLDKSERRTKQFSVLFTLSSILIGIVIAIILARHISKRIDNMSRMADAIASGNYKAFIRDERHDEMSKLSASLNTMAETLSANFSMLEKKNKELNQFAYIVSHDLKAPLRGIMNIISWIFEDHEKELTKDLKNYLQLIESRAFRLEALIAGILSYARTGNERRENEITDVNELVREIIDHLPEKPGLQFKFANLPVFSTARIPLMQIFSNLISNAVKYHNKPTGEIIISCKEGNDSFIFSVKDDGPGIAEAYHEKIFKIFQTLDDNNSFENTGVGLAITKKILEEREEKITLISSPGDGAEFIFSWSRN